LTATTAEEPIATSADPVTADRASAMVERVALGLTLLPFAVAAVVLIVFVRDSYLPISDHALTQMHVRDVGHHAVLTGLYSREDWSHPGPMLFYVLAPFSWLTGGSAIGLGLGALAINASSVAGMALVARRRGGTALMLVTLVLCALAMRTLGADFLRDPWNTYVTALPFGLLIFLVWAMSCGERWALPVGVIVASFLSQTHVGFVLLAMPLLAFGAGWLAVTTLRANDEEDRRSLLRLGGLSALIGVVLWLPVAIDALVHRPSNVVRIARYFRHPDGALHSLGDGLRVVSGQFDVLPQWLRGRPPTWFSGESAYLFDTPWPLLLALAIGAGVAFRRMRHADGLRLLAVLGVAFLLGVFAVMRTIGLVFDYRLRWTWMIGTIGAIAVIWCALLMLERRRAHSGGGAIVGVALAALVACTAINVTAAATAGVPQEADVDVLEALVPNVLAHLADDPDSTAGQVIVDDGPFQGSAWYARSLVLQLEEQGYDARMPPPRGDVVGSRREQDDGPVAAHLVVAIDEEIAARDGDPGLTPLVRWTSVTADQQRASEATRAQLDRDFEAGRIDAEQHARGLLESDLDTYDDAFAWAVAVYAADDGS